MLGRESPTSRAPRTRFNEHDTSPDAEPVLRATDLTRRHVLDRRLRRRPRRRGRRPGRPAGLGSHARRPRRSSARNRSTPGRSGRAARRCGAGPRGRDRRRRRPDPRGPQGRGNRPDAVGPRQHRAGRAAAADRGRIRLRATPGRRRRTLVTRLRIKASSPDQQVGELSGGNQQKVLLARMLCLDPQRPAARRADPRHRRRRQGRDPGADRRARRARAWAWC